MILNKYKTGAILNKVFIIPTTYFLLFLLIKIYFILIHNE